MADITQHCLDCKKELGNDYIKINQWFDEFSLVDGKFDSEHRVHRHHLKGIEEAVSIFGEVARDVGRVHIVRDLYGIPKDEKDFIGGNFTNWLYYKD